MFYIEKDRFFFEKDAESVAKWLLGKELACIESEERLSFVITEVEAYDDSACYGYNKEETKATNPLFQKGGTMCIYAGMLLISCGDTGKPYNVLVRKIANENEYIEGPFLVGKRLKLKEKFDFVNGADILSENSPIRLNGDDTVHRYSKAERIGLGKCIIPQDREKKEEIYFNLIKKRG